MEEMELSVKELLKKVYATLIERNKPQEIVLPKPADAEIADDSDYERTAIGYMRYKTVNLFKFGSKTYMIGNGEKFGKYPAEPFDSDLLALEVLVNESTELKENLFKEIETSTYFRNSLIYGMDDGRVQISMQSKLGVKLGEIIQTKLIDFVAQKPEYDKRYFSVSTLKPINTKCMTYKPKFADFLVETIEKILSED